MSKVESEIFRTFEISDPMHEREGLRLANVKSHALGHRGDVTLWVPPDDRVGTLLILLHGVNGSHWRWAMRWPRTAQRELLAQLKARESAATAV